MVTKYIEVELPDIQVFMDNPKQKDVGFDPIKIFGLFQKIQ